MKNWSDIEEIAALCVADGRAAGIVAGAGDVFFGAGKTSGGGPVPDRDTLFSTGSISKVFTSLLLADMAVRGEVGLDDPVRKYLPPQQIVPSREGREITLLDLSMHLSALPSFPADVEDPPFSAADPVAHYDSQRMYAFLAKHALKNDIGRYAYSSFGYALLGHALGLRLGTTFAEALTERIFRPLGMGSSTAGAPAENLRARMAVGHDKQLQPLPRQNLNVFAPSGGVWSTCGDMLLFLAAQFAASPLEQALRLMRSRRLATSGTGQYIALGWHLQGDNVFWHNGEVGGFRSFAGINTATQRRLVILCNTSCIQDGVAMEYLAGGNDRG